MESLPLIYEIFSFKPKQMYRAYCLINEGALHARFIRAVKRSASRDR